MDKIVKLDLSGRPFEFPTFELDNVEYAKIVHEINNLYYYKYENKKFAMHRSLDTYGNYYIYYFENHGFGDYNIVERIPD